MNAITVCYYVSIPCGFLIMHISNLQMLESMPALKSILVDPNNKRVILSRHVIFRVTATLVMLLPLLFGESHQSSTSISCSC